MNKKSKKINMSDYVGIGYSRRSLNEIETVSGYDVLNVHQLSEGNFLVIIESENEGCVDYITVDEDGAPSIWHTCHADYIKLKQKKRFRMKTAEELLEEGYSLKQPKDMPGMVRIIAQDKSSTLFDIADLGQSISEDNLTYEGYMVEI